MSRPRRLCWFDALCQPRTIDCAQTSFISVSCHFLCYGMEYLCRLTTMAFMKPFLLYKPLLNSTRNKHSLHSAPLYASTAFTRLYSTQTTQSHASTMSSFEFREIRLAHGPRTRTNDCEICREPISDTDPTSTHVACSDTFHATCFNAWADSCSRLDDLTTCPKCRATFTISNQAAVVLECLSNPDQAAGFLEHLVLITFANLPPTLPESEIYDYSMGDDFPTPAFVELIRADSNRGDELTADYLVRLIQAQDLDPAQFVARQAGINHRIGQGAADNDTVDDYLADMLLLPDQVATDLESIDDAGQRRPRDSVVDRFEREPEQARAWLDAHLNGTRVELHLDQNGMDQVRAAFLQRVDLALQARRQAREKAAGTAPPGPGTD
jgi:Ring finger domain